MISTTNTQSTEISTVDALWVLIQSQTKAVQKALAQRILDSQTSEKTKAQQKMVKAASKREQRDACIDTAECEQARLRIKESLTRAFDELHSGKVHHDARKLFAYI